MANKNRVPGTGPVPKAVVVAAAAIRAQTGGGGLCTRCDGAGYCGIEPGRSIPNPLTVRRTMVGTLAKLVEAGDVVGIDYLRREYDGGLFWPVLSDAMGGHVTLDGQVEFDEFEF